MITYRSIDPGSVKDLNLLHLDYWVFFLEAYEVYRGEWLREFWIAEDKGYVVGFIAVNRKGLCEAIEVLESYRLRGIGRSLCQYSRCYRPDVNANRPFWAKMRKRL